MKFSFTQDLAKSTFRLAFPLFIALYMRSTPHIAIGLPPPLSHNIYALSYQIALNKNIIIIIVTAESSFTPPPPTTTAVAGNREIHIMGIM